MFVDKFYPTCRKTPAFRPGFYGNALIWFLVSVNRTV